MKWGGCAKEKFDFYFIYFIVVYTFTIKKYIFSSLEKFIYF